MAEEPDGQPELRDLATEYRLWVKMFGQEKADEMKRQALEIESLNRAWRLDQEQPRETD